MDDPTRMSCCERDIATQRKNRIILNQLRDADPTRKAILERKLYSSMDGENDEKLPHSHRNCSEHCHQGEEGDASGQHEGCSHPHHHPHHRCKHEKDADEEGDSSDFDDDEDDDDDDEFLKAMIRKRMMRNAADSRSSTSNSTPSPGLTLVTESHIERVALAMGGERRRRSDGPIGPHVVLYEAYSDADAVVLKDPLSVLKEKLEAYADTYRGTRFLRVVPRDDREAISRIDDASMRFANLRKRLHIRSFPSLVCIRGEDRAGETGGVVCGREFEDFGDLRISDDRLFQWLKRSDVLRREPIKQAPKKRGDDDEDEEDEGLSYWCGKEGCSVSFYHEHVNENFFKSEEKMESFLEGV